MSDLQRSDPKTLATEQVGRFLSWGKAISIDQARRVLRILPLSQEEELVEFDAEGLPDDEQLDARLVSY